MSELDGLNQHLEELRKRLLRIVLVVGIITAFLLTFHAEPIQLGEVTLYYPTPEPLTQYCSSDYRPHERKPSSRRCSANSNGTGSGILCPSLHRSTSWHNGWNASNNQRTCRIHQTSSQRK